MNSDEKFHLLHNYDLWYQLSYEEYTDLNVAHNFIETKKGDYICFDYYHLNKLFFIFA